MPIVSFLFRLSGSGLSPTGECVRAIAIFCWRTVFRSVMLNATAGYQIVACCGYIPHTCGPLFSTGCTTGRLRFSARRRYAAITHNLPQLTWFRPERRASPIVVHESIQLFRSHTLSPTPTAGLSRSNALQALAGRFICFKLYGCSCAGGQISRKYSSRAHIPHTLPRSSRSHPSLPCQLLQQFGDRQHDLRRACEHRVPEGTIPVTRASLM